MSQTRQGSRIAHGTGTPAPIVVLAGAATDPLKNIANDACMTCGQVCEYTLMYFSTHVMNNIQKLFIQHFMFSTIAHMYEQTCTLAILTTADL